jgi:hypothetical protein
LQIFVIRTKMAKIRATMIRTETTPTDPASKIGNVNGLPIASLQQNERNEQIFGSIVLAHPYCQATNA